MKGYQHLWLGLGMLLGCGCAYANYAPVEDAWQQPAAQQEQYKVRAGDSLYSIAWAYGLDYHDLAKANGLTEPFDLTVGQILVLRDKVVAKGPSKKPSGKHIARNIKPKKHASPNAKRRQYAKALVWHWPLKGKILSKFDPGDGEKGINIAGRLGASVRAGAAGRVVYSGRGVRGYGNLLIVKHNDEYMSAYAYNKKLLVKQGDKVRRGQVIAQVGQAPSGRAMLHFEIRKRGQSINPLRYLG